MRRSDYYVAKRIAKAVSKDSGCFRAFMIMECVVFFIVIIAVAIIDVSYSHNEAAKEREASMYDYEGMARSIAAEYAREKLSSEEDFSLGSIKEVISNDKGYFVYGFYTITNTTYPIPVTEKNIYEIHISFHEGKGSVIGFRPRCYSLGMR